MPKHRIPPHNPEKTIIAPRSPVSLVMAGTLHHLYQKAGPITNTVVSNIFAHKTFLNVINPYLFSHFTDGIRHVFLASDRSMLVSVQKDDNFHLAPVVLFLAKTQDMPKLKNFQKSILRPSTLDSIFPGLDFWIDFAQLEHYVGMGVYSPLPIPWYAGACPTTTKNALKTLLLNHTMSALITNAYPHPVVVTCTGRQILRDGRLTPLTFVWQRTPQTPEQVPFPDFAATKTALMKATASRFKPADLAWFSRYQITVLVDPNTLSAHQRLDCLLIPEMA